jgi:hypothetical protein
MKLKMDVVRYNRKSDPESIPRGKSAPTTSHLISSHQMPKESDSLLE